MFYLYFFIVAPVPYCSETGETWGCGQKPISLYAGAAFECLRVGPLKFYFVQFSIRVLVLYILKYITRTYCTVNPDYEEESGEWGVGSGLWAIKKEYMSTYLHVMYITVVFKFWTQYMKNPAFFWTCLIGRDFLPFWFITSHVLVYTFFVHTVWTMHSTVLLIIILITYT